MEFSSNKNAPIATLMALAIAGCGQEQVSSAPIKAASAPATIEVPAKAQVEEKPPLQQKLELALRCTTSPKPVEIVRALQLAKVIAGESSEGMDSISYFPTTQPLEVWGLKVTRVFGFDFNQKFFERGPGTAPPVTIGVVVPYEEEKVKQRLKLEGVSAASIEHSVADFLSDGKLKPPLTEIICQEHQ